MKVLIFGGTGFLGRQLTEELLSCGYQVSVITRNRQSTAKKVASEVELLEWDNRSPLSSISNLEAIDGVINFAGESIGNRRWTDSVKQEILQSRINATRAIVKAINDGTIKPKVLINASAVGYYGPRQDEEITEGEAPGEDFLADVCRKWEAEAYKVHNPLTRVVTIRIGVVLGSQGALAKMVTPYKFYAGGPLGKGDQWLSWIHIQDLLRMLRFIIEEDQIKGPVNGTAPNPAAMKDFSKALGEVLGRPSWLSVPEFVLRIALGQMSEMLLHGQRVIPKKVIEAGFEFRFPDLKAAFEDALGNMQVV
ncbi:TIGR01777 family protein [Desulfosporosinus orientis DSM 765]|uniref:TIGR01777 family protein n=1 Tax=Desulfosporosinus orientis (strain ATCC 19365 / DSM 765 / NCIMB 8382 / VKM B-1628 / Singapore I) TaxID=768706 RepID=G7W8R0_DESOD|nr:TIGR01777 family oxidoreductase [Desulfosporosinus orientis]AET67770.1 TIGR01777 family protein [Desulfosporosinus orientis DSM 765]